VPPTATPVVPLEPPLVVPLELPLVELEPPLVELELPSVPPTATPVVPLELPLVELEPPLVELGAPPVLPVEPLPEVDPDTEIGSGMDPDTDDGSTLLKNCWFSPNTQPVNIIATARFWATPTEISLILEFSIRSTFQ